MTRDASPEILVGPLKTSQLGNVLIIDVMAPQGHLVVERGSRIARGSVLVTTVARRVIELSKAGEKVEHIVVVGSSAAPTEHPDLREITANLRELRGKWFSRAKLCLISTGMDLESSDLRQTLGMYDKIFQQFEWGTARTFSTLTGEKGTVLSALTKQLSGIDHLIVQAQFFRGDADNSTETEVKSWIKKLQELRPLEVQILPGAAAHGRKKLKAVTKTRQQQIADEVAEKTGLNVTILEEELLPV